MRMLEHYQLLTLYSVSVLMVFSVTTVVISWWCEANSQLRASISRQFTSISAILCVHR